MSSASQANIFNYLIVTWAIYEGDTPHLVRSIQGGFRRYAVRKELVRSTQKFCYIVRRHKFLR